MNIRKIASRVAQGWQDELLGGLADENTPYDFDSLSIVNGLIVELEHVNKEAHEVMKDIPDDIHKALEIAMDHLVKNPKYYVELAKIVDEKLLPE